MWIKNIIQRFPYLPILILALIIRLWGLELNPVAISHDEIHDLINAKSWAIVGQNAPGTVAGIFTKNVICEGNCIFGELTSFLLIPWMKIAPLGMVWSKIPFLLAALGIVYFGAKFFENLTGKKTIGIITALLLAINPWAIHFGRTAFENLFTFCFYLAGLYFFTKKKVLFKDLLIGLVFMILGSMAYMGAKPLFPFLITLALIYRFLFDKEKNLKQLIIILGLAITFFGSYIGMLSGSIAVNRLEEVSRDTQLTRSVVDEERRISLEIPLLRDLAINKILVTSRYYLERYVKAYSPVDIFFQSDLTNDGFNIPNIGYLYLIDFIFVILGLIYFEKRNLKKTFWFLLLLAVIPIASVINKIGTTFALRSGLMYPILVGLAAIGIEGIYRQANLKVKNIFLFVLLGIYSLSFGYFLIMYMYRMPMAKSASWFYQERVLIKYLSLLREKTEENIVVVSKDPVDVLYLYVFYTKKYNDYNFIHKFNSNLSEKKYEIEGIKLEKQCPKSKDLDTVYIFQKEMGCVDEPNNLVRIAEPRDAGAKFFIIEDKLCQDINLKRYVYPRNLKDFNIEKMSREEFCKNWIVKPE